MTVLFADRMDGIIDSVTRTTAKFALMPGFVSFGGGMPNAKLFPIEEIRTAANCVLEEDGQGALQYGITEGYLPLREHIVELMEKENVSCTADNILILNGSQQGIDFTSRIFLNPGDVIACETPSYVLGLNSYKTYQASFLEIETDDDGMIMEDLEAKLEKTTNVKCIYIIPNYQNPTGRTWSIERREAVVKVAEKHNIPIIEDNPYGDLYYDGDKLPSVKSFDNCGIVIYLGTFSKCMCPGFRVGWVLATPEILKKYNQAKQVSDEHAPNFDQRIISKYLDMYDLEKHVEKIRNEYRKQRDVLFETMEREFPENVKYIKPRGGMFAWVELPEGMDARELSRRGIERKVLVLPGETFYPDRSKINTFRMSYATADADAIKKGIKTVGEIIREMMVEKHEE